MQLSDLLLFIVDSFDLLLGLLSELLELFFHSGNFIGCLSVFVILECLFLSLPDFLQRLFFFLQSFELSLEMFEFILFLNNLIDVILAVQISSEFGDLCLVPLDLQLLIFKFFLQLDNAFVFFDLVGGLFFFLALLLLLSDLVHFGS